MHFSSTDLTVINVLHLCHSSGRSGQTVMVTNNFTYLDPCIAVMLDYLYILILSLFIRFLLVFLHVSQ